jgi:four helix bundle protein
MSRNYKELRVWELADELVVEIYGATAAMPPAERFAMQSQIRRAAVSIAANIVEGCARTTTRDYQHFVTISLGSAFEVRYLLDLARRLTFVDSATAATLDAKLERLLKTLQRLISSLKVRT